MTREMSDLRDLHPRRVCLIKPSSLGDVVHALPVLASLKDRWPDAQFSWVINKGLMGLLEHHPLGVALIPFERSQVGFSPGGASRFLGFLRSLKNERFDLTIDLQGLFRSGLMCAATGSKVRVGLDEAREGSKVFYTHRIRPSASKVHAVDKLMSVVGAFGADTEAIFRVVIREDDRQWAQDELRWLNGPLLVLNVGARWLTKRWPPAKFAEVASRAARELGASLVAVGAPEDRRLVDDLAAALAPLRIHDLCGRTTLPRLAAVLEAADCVLSNDTGPLHLAAATGTRVVGVYTCTSPEKTGPYGPRSMVVSSRIWCAASCVKTCDRLDCMRELVPDRVWSAVRLQLDLATREPRSSRVPSAVSDDF